MPVRLLSCIRAPSLALFCPSHVMSYARKSPTRSTSTSNQAEGNGTISIVNSNTQQEAGASITPSRRNRVNSNVILEHLGLRKKALQRGVSSCNSENSSLSGSKTSFSAVHTHQPAEDSTPKLPVACSEESNPGSDFSSLPVSPSNMLLSQHQCNSAAQIDQVSEVSLQKDGEFLRDVGCTGLSEVYSLPTSFRKKKSPHVAGTMNKKLERHERRNCVEQFDICLSETEAIQAKCSESEDLMFLRSPPGIGNTADDPDGNLLIEEPMRSVLRPGMVLLKKYISPSEQVSIVKKCRELGLGPGGFYRPGYKDGAKLRLHMMCLGWDWDPQTRKYQKRRRIDSANPPNIPHEFHLLVNRAMQDSLACIREASNICNAEKILPRMSPDICIVNFYTETGRLGLHQDRDESAESLSIGLPVVSFSVGDSAEFLYGDQRDVKKAEKLVLKSGDVLVFGGDSRHVFHGIGSIIPDSTPEYLLKEPQLRPGRLNLTFRQY